MAQPDMKAGESEADLHRLYLENAQNDVAALTSLIAELAADPAQWASVTARMREVVHNIKGQGTSFGYPLMTRVGESLSILLKRGKTADDAVTKLARAHIETLRTVLDKDIKGSGGELGETLACRLESLVDKLA